MIKEIYVGGVWQCIGYNGVVVSYREPSIESLFQVWVCVGIGLCDYRDLCWWSVEWWLL